MPREMHERDRLPHPARDLVRGDAAHLQAEGDVAAHAHMREQRVALEHQAHVALVGRHLGEVVSVDDDSPWTRGVRPAIIRSDVVLPQPDGPRKATSSPFGTSRSRPSTAAKSP